MISYLRPQGVGLDGQAVAGAPAGAAGERVAILSDLLDFGVEAPGGVVRHAVAVQVAGVAGGVGGVPRVGRRIPAEGAEIREAVLFALRAGRERHGEVIVDVPDEAAAAAIADRIVAGQILALIVVGRAGAKAELRTLVVERGDGADVDRRGDAARHQRGVLGLVDLRARQHFGRIDLPAQILRRLRRSHFAAVHQPQHQSRPQSAHGCLTGIAAITRGVDAGQTIEFLGDRDVGQLADFRRGDVVADDVGIFLGDRSSPASPGARR